MAVGPMVYNRILFFLGLSNRLHLLVENIFTETPKQKFDVSVNIFSTSKCGCLEFVQTISIQDFFLLSFIIFELFYKNSIGIGGSSLLVLPTIFPIQQLNNSLRLRPI